MTEGGFQRAIAPSPTFYTTWGVGGWAFLDPAHLDLMAFLLVVLLGISTVGLPRREISLHQQASARGLYLLHKPIKPAHLVKVMVELLYAP